MTLPANSKRLHALDALRGFALLLGVALHAAMSYLPGAEFFRVTSDSKRSLALAGGFHWVHSFRMTLFFIALCLLSYQLLVRRTWVGGWLNGRRVARAPA